MTVQPQRRRALVPWWVALIVLGAGVILGLVWLLMGGLPFTNHAAYGRVPVPGSGAVALPAAEVWIHFEEDGIFGENDSAEMPSDLQVLIDGSPQSPTQPALLVERLSANLFSVSNGETGHVPYGRVKVPAAATYEVTTLASQQTSAISPRVTFGEPPWNPFGPPIVGALVLLAPFALLALILLLPIRREAPTVVTRPTLI